MTKQVAFFCAVLLLTFAVGAAPAQTLGTIIGAVTDDTGGVIPGVEVRITNQEQGTSSVVRTQSDGSYRLPNVQPGSYSIRIEADGFRAHVVENLRLEVGSILTYDAILEVGTVTETVTVEAATPLVETSRGSLGAVVENKRVLELPLPTREIFDLIDLTPGAQRMRNSNRAGGGDVTIAGGRTRSAGVFIDGVVNSRTGIGATITELSTPIDASLKCAWRPTRQRPNTADPRQDSSTQQLSRAPMIFMGQVTGSCATTPSTRGAGTQSARPSSAATS